VTDKGVAYLSDFVAAIREEIGMEVPLASDHYGHIDVNSCIRLARAMEKHQLAWMEDMVPWQFGHLMKQIKDATETPILTGEDMVTGLPKPLVKDGHASAPDAPGLGVELNPDVVKQHLLKGEGYFEPTPQWDTEHSWDRLWS